MVFVSHQKGRWFVMLWWHVGKNQLNVGQSCFLFNVQHRKSPVLQIQLMACTSALFYWTHTKTMGTIKSLSFRNSVSICTNPVAWDGEGGEAREVTKKVTKVKWSTFIQSHHRSRNLSNGEIIVDFWMDRSPKQLISKITSESLWLCLAVSLSAQAPSKKWLW